MVVDKRPDKRDQEQRGREREREIHKREARRNDGEKNLQKVLGMEDQENPSRGERGKEKRKKTRSGSGQRIGRSTHRQVPCRQCGQHCCTVLYKRGCTVIR